MLSYEICVALRDAGFPQLVSSTGHAVYYHAHRPEWGVKVSLLKNGGDAQTMLDADEIACPNSDELLAALQAKYNGLHRWGVKENAGQWVAYCVTIETWVTKSDTVSADSPVAALAALYITLAQETT